VGLTWDFFACAFLRLAWILEASGTFAFFVAVDLSGSGFG
jgi:hypothetical protein